MAKENAETPRYPTWDELRNYWIENFLEWYQKELSRLEKRFQESASHQTSLTNTDAAVSVRKQLDRATPSNLASFITTLNPLIKALPRESPNQFVILNSNGEDIAVLWRSSGKLWSQGAKKPAIDAENGIYTRLYVSIDPITAADAFFELIAEFEKHDVLSAVDICLFFEALNEDGKAENNTVVIYVQDSSKSELLNSILASYRTTKKMHPNLFTLNEDDFDELALGRLATYRGQVDRNMTFVEVPGESAKASSWDAGSSQEIDLALGINPAVLTTTKFGRVRERLNAMDAKRSYKIYSRASKAIVNAWMNNPDSVENGSVFHLKQTRLLSCPALVQYQLHTVVKFGQRLVPITEFWQHQAQVQP